MKTLLVIASILAIVYFFYKNSKKKKEQIGIVKGIIWLSNKIAAITIQNNDKTSTHEVYVSTETAIKLAEFEKKQIQVKIFRTRIWSFPFVTIL